MSEIKNLIITVTLSSLILIGWQYFYENPRIENTRKYNLINNQKQLELSKLEIKESKHLNRDELINYETRVKIASHKLTGSINLNGLRFDDLSLTEYKNSLSEDNKNVTLLSPASSIDSYFIELGWITKSASEVPDSNTKWNSDKVLLENNDSINCYWENNQGVKFIVNISLDNDYMFTIKQSVINNSNDIIQLAPYGLINKLMATAPKSYSILHEGPLGVFNSKLVEKSYESLKPGKRQNFDVNGNGDWLGITDKYWLTAIFPSKDINFNSSFVHTIKSEKNLYQVDYLGHVNIVKPNEHIDYTQQIFAGAKELKILDKYKDTYKLKLFDRAVDFGWFYFLTKPIFNALQYFYKLSGNFGIAILILTIIVKAIMFPLATKSYKSMNKMKKLQPELNKIKEIYGDDKLRINKEMIELYKKYNVNPLAGCLPIIIQIPVFFSLYKALFVTIEMRHAKFFGWINDLSAPDPTSLFNLFGLLPWTPPSFLMIGVWPMLMGITMFLQQKMNPEPSDPVQAQVMKFLPLIFVFMFSSFPAGLVIYWAWNNLLSIIQQYIINKTAS